jgi:hypothetical protein
MAWYRDSSLCLYSYLIVIGIVAVEIIIFFDYFCGNISYKIC